MSTIKRAAAVIAVVGAGTAASQAEALTVVAENLAPNSPATINLGSGDSSGTAQYNYGKGSDPGVFTAVDGAAIGSLSATPGISSLDTYTVDGSTNALASCGETCSLIDTADPYLHLKFDIGGQEELGYAVFDSTGTLTEIAYEAVPEPASWALMLTGVGAVGVALRRARRCARLVAA